MSDTTSGSAGGSSIIGTELVSLDADLGSDKNSVIVALAERLAANGRASDADALTAAVLDREAKSATGLPGGIAIPHARSEAVTTPSLGFARLSPKADFGAPDGPADLVFLIAAPEGAGGDHMKLLTALARALVRPDFVASLRAAASAEEVIALVEDVLPPRPAPSSSAPAGTGSLREAGGRASAERRTARRPHDRRGHRVPDRHRAHLYGRRRAGRRR
ncbi:PTS system fructose-specific IIC component [Rhodococcus rhodochrous J45]|uniref:PTS system fructose-specific IIC component n=1 Tax=Rhodococcus rhodochrous J45 TaxID=935266 RepID=A0A562E5B7_RHORH|nr:PTS system fructose-specific IIC component [Rhodococcus rhodochrous J45]